MRAGIIAIGVVAFIGAACSSVDIDDGLDAAGADVGARVDAPEVSTPAGERPSTSVNTVSTTRDAPASTASTTTETVPPPRQPVVVGVAGDSTFTNGLETRDPFGQIADLLRAPDLMLINLETAVADAGVGRPPVDKAFLFKSPPAALDLLVDAGVDGVTLGNNHALDFGPEALAQTLDELDARELMRVGAGRTEAEAYAPLIVPVGEWTLGVVSLSRVPCDWSASGDNTRPEIGWACPPFQDAVDAAAQSAVEQADVTIVSFHGGEEGVLCPSPFMVELTDHMSTLGVDVVINGHPHVLQGIGRHGDTLAAYSTGNFAFPPAGGLSGNTAIVEVVISEGGVDLRMVPVRSEGGVLRPPTESERLDIIDQVNRHSNGMQLDESGTAVEAPNAESVCF